jgi:hypothetical protein
MAVLRYFVRITPGKMVLWCYLLWYLVTLYFYFDPSPRLWLNSLGICVVIGFALMLSVSRQSGAKTDYWQIFRLFMMPFCVSSFSSLIKGQGFIFILPPKPVEQVTSVAVCVVFVALVCVIKYASRFIQGMDSSQKYS